MLGVSSLDEEMMRQGRRAVLPSSACTLAAAAEMEQDDLKLSSFRDNALSKLSAEFFHSDC